jgi:thiosulfate reductase cytochrome b subunit
MAESTYLGGFELGSSEVRDQPRHALLVRITHWISTLSFFGLLVSGVAILLAHPRLYWGDTGAVGLPSLIDLPLPFLLGHSGWGRYLHFLSAWICVLNGGIYVLSGLFSGHFRHDFLTGRVYGAMQRFAYLGVVFLLLPLTIWTGLAMSPALTAVFPELVTTLGGQQSARTIHFFAALSLTGFLVIHVAMVWRAGFVTHVRSMITGRT